jgi:hypothetical protein
MLPRIASIDREFDAAARSHVFARSRSGSVFREIRPHMIHEGRSRITRSDSDIEMTKMKEAVVEAKFDFSDVESVDTNYILAKINELAEQIKEHQSKTLFETLREATQRTGQVVNAAGGPLTNELMMKIVAMMPVNFENSDKGDLAIVVPPAMAETISKLDREMKENPQLRREWNNMMEKKRDDFRTREANRNLVG